ncbi:MAG TPA: hypothetical protein VNJ12_01450 [Candidatus Dormibacteraeota bacterium]|nr:hypothetical protein [Candidatus Dormibacteraeota bacterium]
MKPAVILVFLALTAPASARAHPLRWARSHVLEIAADALMIGASALDVASTRSAVRGGNYEANPLYGARPGLGRLVLVKAAFDVPVAVGSYFLGRRTRDEPRWKRAEILMPALILAIPQLWAAHHNWTLRKAP